MLRHNSTPFYGLSAHFPELAHYFAHPWPGGVPPQDDAQPLHSFVARGAKLINGTARRSLRHAEPHLRMKAADLSAAGRTSEARCVQFLLRFLAGSRSAGPRSAALCRSVNEAAFALLYLLADEDLIPDYLTGVGFTDDAAVLSAVLIRNERVLRDLARHAGIDWNAVHRKHDGFRAALAGDKSTQDRASPRKANARTPECIRDMQ